MLAICLVFLTLLTLLAVATVGTATVELRLAANAQHRVAAFYLAEIAIAGSLDTLASNPALLDTSTPFTIARTAVPGHGAYEAATVLQEFGSACDEPTGQPAIRRHFEIRASGYSGRNAVANHRRGFYVCGPGPEQTLVPTFWAESEF